VLSVPYEAEPSAKAPAARHIGTKRGHFAICHKQDGVHLSVLPLCVCVTAFARITARGPPLFHAPPPSVCLFFPPPPVSSITSALSTCFRFYRFFIFKGCVIFSPQDRRQFFRRLPAFCLHELRLTFKEGCLSAIFTRSSSVFARALHTSHAHVSRGAERSCVTRGTVVRESEV